MTLVALASERAAAGNPTASMALDGDSYRRVGSKVTMEMLGVKRTGKRRTESHFPLLMDKMWEEHVKAS